MRIFRYWLETIVCSLLVFLVIGVSFQILFRVTAISAPWIEEIVRITFAYMVFLGIVLGVKYSEHLSVDLISGLPAKFHNIIIAFGYFLTLIFLIFFTYFGFVHTIDTMGQYTPTLEISNFYLHLVIPISGILMLYYIILNITRLFREVKGDVDNQ